MKTPKFTIFLFIMAKVLVSCNDDALIPEPVQNGFPKSQLKSRTFVDSIPQNEISILEATEELMTLKDISENIKKNETTSLIASTDDYFSTNIRAINEIPITIKVRTISSNSTSGYNYLFVNGNGKEVTLNNSNTIAGSRFYIKLLPATSGIPYLIYSNVTNTPLAVGQYTNNPDKKILMAKQEDSGSLFGCSWDFLPSSSYKGYFSIESESYLGQSDPNNLWSVFNYVLEAKENNTLGYAQRVLNKGQQEFLITPIFSFILDNLEFDLDKATVTSSTEIIKVTSLTNPNPFPQKEQFTVSVSADETSLFVPTQTKLNIPVENSRGFKFPRPLPIANKAVLFDDTPKDALYSTTTQKIKNTVSYSTSIEMKPNTLMQLTSKFKTFTLNVPYTATAKYTYKNLEREIKIVGIWKGYTIANPLYNKPIEEPRFFDLETGNPLNYSLFYDSKQNIYIVK